MSRIHQATVPFWWKFPVSVVSFPLWLLTWPFLQLIKVIDQHFVSYLSSRVLRDSDRIYSIKFVWYNDSIYLHPMIWGSFILYFVAQASLLAPGWLILFWFMALLLSYITVMYNLNVLRASMLAVGVVAVLGVSYFSTMELQWNPLAEATHYISSLGAEVSPGFFLASGYFFSVLIVSEVIWAWLFHRVEIDESYVYERKFLLAATREPIFARGLKREIKDLLELLVLGAADIQHRTRNGYKRFKNVPFASLWLGTALDKMLDHRRPEQVKLERSMRDQDDQSRLDDALHEDMEDIGAGDDADADEDGFA